MLHLKRSDGGPLRGQLFYVESDYGFQFKYTDKSDLLARVGADGVTSLVFDTLQLEIGVATRQLLFAWGYHPRNPWVRTSVPPPVAEPGTLTVENDNGGFQPGVSVDAARGKSWTTFFDPTSGWLKVVMPGDEEPDEHLTLIADGIVVGSARERIHSLWLNPAFAAEAPKDS